MELSVSVMQGNPQNPCRQNSAGGIQHKGDSLETVSDGKKYYGIENRISVIV